MINLFRFFLLGANICTPFPLQFGTVSTSLTIFQKVSLMKRLCATEKTSTSNIVNAISAVTVMNVAPNAICFVDITKRPTTNNDRKKSLLWQPVGGKKKKFGETHVFTKMEESVRNMKYDQNRKKNETHKLHIYSKHTKLCKEKII